MASVSFGDDGLRDKEEVEVAGDAVTNCRNDPINSADDAGGEDEDAFSFLGYVRPTPMERIHGHASRTELYRCRSCNSYTRFPRNNRAAFIANAKRGRCGEYSMLLYRMLRALGYDGVRWVVDWADHVWVEVWLGRGRTDDACDRSDETLGVGGRWVHLDPCEASVDNPLLYESWGKNQTYIVAFHDPFYVGDSRDNGPAAAPTVIFDNILSKVGAPLTELRETTISPESTRTRYAGRWFSPVEDVTRHYTSDETHVIEERRGIHDTVVDEAISKVANGLVDMLQRLMRGESSYADP